MCVRGIPAPGCCLDVAVVGQAGWAEAALGIYIGRQVLSATASPLNPHTRVAPQHSQVRILADASFLPTAAGEIIPFSLSLWSFTVSFLLCH